MGTGGTLSGTSRYLKAQNPKLRVVLAHPAQEPSRIAGVTDDEPPPEFRPAPIDRVVRIADEVAIETSRKLARQEGLIVGLSSGAAMAAALVDAPSWPEGTRAVVIAPDTGRNELSILAP